MLVLGGSAAAAFLIGYFMFDIGYGFRTFLNAARGVKGMDTSTDWTAQSIAQKYMRNCVSYPFFVNIIILFFTFGAIIGFVGLLATQNIHGKFISLEFSCLIALSAIILFPFTKKRGRYIENIFSEESDKTLRNRIKSMQLRKPLMILDFSSIYPSLVAIVFFVTAIIGLILMNFSAFHRLLSIETTIPLWTLTFLDLFGLPLFLGWALLGLFPWPFGRVPDSEYYPLLVLQRAL